MIKIILYARDNLLKHYILNPVIVAEEHVKFEKLY